MTNSKTHIPSSPSILPFAGRIVAVTGAGAGIGRALALGFAEDGAQVVAIGRTLASLETTARIDGSGRVSVIVQDIASDSGVGRMCDQIEVQHGPIDVLVNNAAIYHKATFVDCDLREWINEINTNLCGMVHLCHRLLPGMLSREYGRIINVGSFAWQDPIKGASAYSASKAAVHAFTKGLAREVDRYIYPNVLVNEWIPGIFKTQMSPELGEDPALAYPGARLVADLPPGGPHGQVFLRDQLMVSAPRLRSRILNAVRLVAGR